MLLSNIDRSPQMRIAGLLVVAFVLSVSAGPTGQPPAAGLLVTPTGLAASLGDPALVILHVGEDRSEYTQAHIPGARFVPYRSASVEGADDLGAELPSPDALKELFESVGVSDTSRAVIYGHPVLASRLFFTLDAAGHSRVTMLDGGLPAWQNEGRPVAQGEQSTPPRGRFTPRVNAGRLATADWIRTHAATIALVDVRPDPEFTGSDGGMGGAHAPGHIEGAAQLPWNTLVGPDGRFLPPEQLRVKLASAGVAPGKPVVSYCMIGMRASVVYFVARHLGLDARLYDGSIVDWGRRKLPTKIGR
jgi:thiosulfate/3-mercaptopyruvate sulfurtransferase